MPLNKENENEAYEEQDVPILMKNRHPVYMMVFGVVTGVGDVMPPFIFSHSLRLTYPVGWGWIIYQLRLCKGVTLLLMNVLL